MVKNSNDENERREEKTEYLVFRIADENYGVEVKYVKQIIKKGDILPVHGLPNFILGLTSVNGEIFPVIDLKAKFELLPNNKYDKFSIIIVLIVEEEEVSIIADSVLDIYTIFTKDLQPTVINKKDKIFTPFESSILDLHFKIIDLEQIFNLKNLY